MTRRLPHLAGEEPPQGPSPPVSETQGVLAAGSTKPAWLSPAGSERGLGDPSQPDSPAQTRVQCPRESLGE